MTQVSVCRSYAEHGGRYRRADVLTASVGFWTDVMGGGMDATLTGVDQIQVGEQQASSLLVSR